MSNPTLLKQPPARKPVAGIVPIQGHSPNAGLFRLPPLFDRNKYSAAWKEVGPEADHARQVQVHPRLGLQAPGWEPWKNPETGNVYEVVTRGRDGKKFILLFRPREVTTELNALYGDKSKAEIYKTQTGENILTAEGSAPSGMLTEVQLKQMEGSTEEDQILQPKASSTHQSGPLSATLKTKE